MGKAKPTYYLLKHQISSVLMIIALVWLTISAPFVYAAKSPDIASHQQQNNPAQDEECSNPFAGSEEKTEGGVNTLSEYLHEAHSLEHGYLIIVRYEKCHADDLYFAYHPELVSPPPDAVLA
jgi:hypothetical protein